MFSSPNTSCHVDKYYQTLPVPDMSMLFGCGVIRACFELQFNVFVVSDV